MSLSKPRLKWKKCPECGEKFVQVRPKQPVCDNLACKELFALKVISRGERKREKVERANNRQKKEELQPIQYWLKRAEKAVNAFIRERDREQPCISCGTNDAAEWHAGHWKSVGANSSLRFDPENIHRQCDQCNVFKGGNGIEYEIRLPARIGQAEVDRLKHAPRLRKWTREECQAIEQEFKAKLKGLRERVAA